MSYSIEDPLGGSTAAPPFLEILGPPCSPSRSTFLLSLRVLARSRQVLGKVLAFLCFLGCGRGIFWPKALPKPSQNPPQSLQNRPWRRPRRYLPKTLNLRRLPSRLPYRRRSHFEPTWLHLGGPRGSKIEAKTRKNRC